MPRAITCVTHGKYKIYWTGWRHVNPYLLVMIAQWYAVSESEDAAFVASYPGTVARNGCVDHAFDCTMQRDQICVIPSTPYKVKNRIKAELLYRLVKFLDEHDQEIANAETQ
jgi:hypothetical protein